MMKQPNKWDTAGYCIDTIYENMDVSENVVYP